MIRGTRPLLSGSSRALVFRRALAAPSTRFSQQTAPRPTLTSPIRAPGSKVPSTWRIGYATKPPQQPNKVDKKHEKELGQQKLASDPEHVTAESSVRHFVEATSDSSQTGQQNAQDVSAGISQDLNTVKETFSLTSVPREAYALGLAGTLPYLATSLSTVYLSWDINTLYPTQSHFVNSFMISQETAKELLSQLEPIQIGYGAVLISFLGAIHWGMEFSEKSALQPRTNFRYGLGVAASLAAWPTVFLPIEWALSGQFAAFTLLYFADARATSRGWAPTWYGTYRFVLTFIVGSAIFISLISRTKIGDTKARLGKEDLAVQLKRTTVGEKPYRNFEKEEAEEKERIKKEKEEEEKRKKEEEKKQKADAKKDKGKSKDKSKEKESSKEDSDDSGEKKSDGDEKKGDGEKKDESKDK